MTENNERDEMNENRPDDRTIGERTIDEGTIVESAHHDSAHDEPPHDEPSHHEPSHHEPYQAAQETFISRIGRLFRRAPRPNGNSDSSGSHAIIDPRPGIARPWGRQSAAIARLQEGFDSLTDLMSAIKQNLETQNRRQDELVGYLSTLPKVLEMMPEASRAQAETLGAIRDQLVNQSEQQAVLGDILAKLSESGGDQREVLEGLRERVEKLNEQDRKIAENMENVGSAMASASKNTQTSTQVLEQMRDNMSARDGELERVLHRQAAKFTAMLAVAIFIAIAALVAVLVMGYVVMYKPH